MSTNRFYYFLTLILSFSFWGCDSDNNPKPDTDDTYGEGAYVVNEGGFGSANGSITYFTNGEAEQAIYQSVNGEFAGDVLQSVTFDDDTLIYLVLNGSNKIAVAHSSTFEAISTLTDDDLIMPRYASLINDKLYVSVWGPYDEYYSLTDSYILVIDPSTGTVDQKIDTDEGTERLLHNGTYLFASNYNYGASNTVAAIDPTNNIVEKNIEVGAGPVGMVLDANNKLWVICTGTYGGNDGTLCRIDPSSLTIEATIALNANPDGDLAISTDQSTLIYNVGTSVYAMDITDTEAPDAVLFTASDVTAPYGLDVDAATGDIYICDALDYSAAGKVFVYSSTGTLQTSFTTGISPTGVVFR